MSEPDSNRAVNPENPATPANTAADSPELAGWLGKRESRRELIDPAGVEGMAVALDHPGPIPGPGDPLPAGWHWMYFAARVRPAEIGADGHPARGGFLPPVPLPRRMWAGGRVTLHAPIRVGEELVRESEITAITPKTGRSGAMVFVTARHRISGPAGLAIEEEQDIVYREAEGPAQSQTKESRTKESPTKDSPTAAKAETGGDGPPATGSPAAGSAEAGRVVAGRDGDGRVDWRRTITPGPVLLFRYSALTFNGHRIHYDRSYVTGVEGYPGLIVHGPLTATLLLGLAAEKTGRPFRRYAFRGRRPLFDTAPFELMGRMDEDGQGCELWAADPDGNVAMTATVEFAE